MLNEPRRGGQQGEVGHAPETIDGQTSCRVALVERMRAAAVEIGGLGRLDGSTTLAGSDDSGGGGGGDGGLDWIGWQRRRTEDRLGCTGVGYGWNG